jgi:hypothetical protein
MSKKVGLQRRSTFLFCQALTSMNDLEYVLKMKTVFHTGIIIRR